MITIMLSNVIEQVVMKSAKRRLYPQGAYLFHCGDPVRSVFFVHEGAVELLRPQPDGTTIMLQRAGPHAVIAEASLYSKIYHCDACAALPSIVFVMSKTSFLSVLRTDPKCSELWASHLANEVQAARFRSEILSRKTVAERLDIWLDWQNVDLPPKGEWRSLAAQIGVSPEALYRELSKRRAKAKR